MQGISLANGTKKPTDWQTTHWTRAYRTVRNLRQRIFRATQEGNLKKVRSLQKLMLKSYSNRLVSVRRVAQVNAGKKTPGIDGMVVKSPAARGKLVDTLNQYTAWKAKPARRVYIPKANGKKRPLGMPVWSDKLLAEVIRMILSAYYDCQFSDHSHGFREGRRCHTALQEIYHTWKGCVWIIEGDISDCFGSLSHALLIKRLKENIQDGRFLHLISALLDAGYFEDWEFNRTLSGVPQGGLCKALHKPPYAKQVTMQRDVRKPWICGHFQLNFFA
ncbi:MAG TPA: reverse transcriptase N-terminal domain-containing protein [Ktedonobacteraceae bacterium]|nr:reverse transcriptase N-terminal domain-containing protein [Ktedonobacteraceae bacterium]